MSVWGQDCELYVQDQMYVFVFSVCLPFSGDQFQMTSSMLRSIHFNYWLIHNSRDYQKSAERAHELFVLGRQVPLHLSRSFWMIAAYLVTLACVFCIKTLFFSQKYVIILCRQKIIKESDGQCVSNFLLMFQQKLLESNLRLTSPLTLNSKSNRTIHN